MTSAPGRNRPSLQPRKRFLECRHGDVAASVQNRTTRPRSDGRFQDGSPGETIRRCVSRTHYREATLAHDFAAVRELVFKGDRRRLMDMRRSGAAEAVAGHAKPGTLSAKLANSIETSNLLHKTYSPVDLASVRSADKARLRGRRRMRDEND